MNVSVQVCEYYQDFDPLRERSIPRSKFRMGLSAMGLSALGQFNLSNAEFKALSDTYADPANPDCVLWQNFEKEIETGKTPFAWSYDIFVCPAKGREPEGVRNWVLCLAERRKQ